jgi:aspartate carbamoyltransferase catalytic subunit
MLKSRHLLGIADLDAAEIGAILDTAEAMTEIAARPIKKVPTLRGRTVVNLFFEPSTRTRTSFEVAEKRLSADTLSVAIAQSSVTKGETLLDTVRNLEAMAPDMIVMRHASSGAPHLLARLCRSAIINAGDGMHEHPTQALLDAFTIRSHKGHLEGLKPRAAIERASPEQDGGAGVGVRPFDADAARSAAVRRARDHRDR